LTFLRNRYKLKKLSYFKQLTKGETRLRPDKSGLRRDKGGDENGSDCCYRRIAGVGKDHGT